MVKIHEIRIVGGSNPMKSLLLMLQIHEIPMVKIHEIRIVGGSNPMKSLLLMAKIHEIPIVDG